MSAIFGIAAIGMIFAGFHGAQGLASPWAFFACILAGFAGMILNAGHAFAGSGGLERFGSRGGGAGQFIAFLGDVAAFWGFYQLGEKSANGWLWALGGLAALVVAIPLALRPTAQRY